MLLCVCVHVLLDAFVYSVCDIACDVAWLAFVCDLLCDFVCLVFVFGFAPVRLCA